jgi:hypothetical protein
MYVPHGWFHHVESLTDAISMTWNFVHKTTASAMEAWLREQPLSAFDKSVLQFFYKFGAENDVKESMLRLIRN